MPERLRAFIPVDLTTLTLMRQAPGADPTQQYVRLGTRSATAPSRAPTAVVRRPPDAARARAVDLTGLPATWIDCGIAEVVRDEDVAFASASASDLRAAGGRAELRVREAAFHDVGDFAPAPASREPPSPLGRTGSPGSCSCERHPRWTW